VHVLVAVDLSPATDRVVRKAAALVQGLRANCTILHAVRPQSGGNAAPADVELRHVEVERLVHRLQADGLLASGGIKVSDDETDDAIVREARSVGADYIVVGSHGHGRSSDPTSGRVSQGVVRRASVPVVIVPIRRR
jgi:nucleotide-binding universal stress UspA family protein